MIRRFLWQGLILLIASVFVSACGGSSPNNVVVNPGPFNQPPPPPTPPPPTPPPGPTVDSFRTAEYNLSWALEAINAAQAYTQGFTGAGQIIGMVDFNFELNSGEVNYHSASVGVDQNLRDIYEAQIGESATTNTHGHAVAATAAGRKNNSGIHGVAFDAQILAVDFFSGVNLASVPQSGFTLHVSNPWTYLMDRGVRVVSKSFGFDEGDIITNPPVVSQKYTIETEAFVIARDGLLVNSAGNNGHADPSLSNLNLIDILANNNLLDGVPGAFIIAGAVDENNQIASFSDRAGQAMQYYMVAPGVDVVFPWNGDLVIGSGTSFAAPIIAGAAAVIFDKWPTLTAREVRQILFDSATDLGAPGIDAIYGHGLLNLNAALQPLGQLTLAVTTTDTAPELLLSGIFLGPIFGDAPDLMAGLSNIMTLDGFERDFQTDLSSLVSTGRTQAPLDLIIDARRAWQSSSLSLSKNATINLAFGENRWDALNLQFLGQAARDIGPRRDVIFELNGRAGKFDLAFGTGARLSDAISDRTLAPYGGDVLSLSQAFSNNIEPGTGTYATAALWLNRKTRMQVGAALSKSEGVFQHPIEALRQNTEAYLTALRLDRYENGVRAGAEVGIMAEDGSILGSRSAGGLALTDRAQTAWVKIDGEIRVTPSVSLAMTATGALTDPGSVSGSLFGAIGTLTSTSFALRMSKQGMLKQGDAFSLTFHQPLRVEQAAAILVSGVGRDLESGGVVFGNTAVSLAPSGRELSLEAAYGIFLGLWKAEANLAFRYDADHVAGRRDLTALISFSRLF